MGMYFSRILNDRKKLAIIIFVVLIPVMEIIQIAYQTWNGNSMPNPHYATFLSLFTIRHYLHKILLWFLPIFLLLIANEDCLEDNEIKFKNTLLIRMGKKEYIRDKMIGSFVLSFIVIGLGLLINMVLVYICFRDGIFLKDEFLDYKEYDISRITVPNPIIANLAYIVLTAFLAGLLGAAGTSLAMTLRERKIVYGLTFLLWFIPVMSKESLMYVIQPFIRVNYRDVLPTLVGLILCYIIIIAASILVEVKDDDL